MMQLMQDKPALAQELIVTLLNKPRKHKRKATEINIM